MTTKKVKVAIIGAGPTGLGAAWRLTELAEQNWLLFEASNNPGGLAGSVVDKKGFLWDFGGHVLFSHYEYFDQVVNQCMQDEWYHHERQAWVWLRNQFIPYPFQNNIWRLPPEDLVGCLDGLLSVHNKPAVPLRSDSFEDWIFRNFGKGLAEIFFLPYNYKVWAYPPNRLSSCWIQERVATVDLSRILTNLVMRKDDLGWGPNSTFAYPKHGGTGMIWQRVAERLDQERMIMGTAVTSVNPKERQLELADGSTVTYEYLLSSIPLDKLIKMISGVPELRQNDSSFLYSSVLLVGVGVEGVLPEVLKSKCWMYFVEDQFPFYRMTVLSNYSKANVPNPEKQWSLLCEISESPDKHVDHAALESDVLRALKEIGLLSDQQKVVSLFQKRLEYGYPTPFLGRDEIITPLNKALYQMDILSRGRFGAWKYEVSNQDHSFMQGVEAIDHVLFGTEEITYNHPSVVNSGKRDTRKNRFPPAVG